MALWKYKIPKFDKGRLLRSEALEEMRDYPKEILELWGNNLSDGVVSGFLISQQESNIIVGPGILRHGGKCWVLREPCVLQHEHYNMVQQIFIRVLAPKEEEDFIVYPFEVELSDLREPQKGEYELGRYCLQEGAHLRGIEEYQDFKDLTTEYNTVNLLAVPMAGIGSATLHPVICKKYVMELQEVSKDPVDDLFIMLCLNSNIIQKQVIVYYLKKKRSNLQSAVTDERNDAIYHQLLLILELEKGNKNGYFNYSSAGRSIID